MRRHSNSVRPSDPVSHPLSFSEQGPFAPLLQIDFLMKKSKQLTMFKSEPRFFGGLLLQGRRRGRRPLSSKEPIHLVMRSVWAVGGHSLLRRENKAEIEKLITIISHRFGVKVYRRAIASNHVHLVIRPIARTLYNKFIRALSGKVASQVMRGQSFKEFKRLLAGEGVHGTTEIQGKGQRFWQFRPFTRVLCWGRDYRGACAYVAQNVLEALGFLAYKPRGPDRYARWIRPP
jgi:putative transposase